MSGAVTEPFIRVRNLRKVYRKTGVTSRVQLAQMLMEQNAAPVPED